MVPLGFGILHHDSVMVMSKLIAWNNVGRQMDGMMLMLSADRPASRKRLVDLHRSNNGCCSHAAFM